MKKYNYNKKGKLILGVNGWSESSHDASAALIEVSATDCKILGALEEEKVIKQKCAFDTLPIQAIDYLLASHELCVDDIDYIVFGWNYPKLYKLRNKNYPYKDNDVLLKQLFPNKSFNKKIPIVFIDHHLAHAACSYRTSNFTDALTVVIDGQGEDESVSIWLGKNNDMELLEKISIKESLGYLYEAVNEILNFRHNESGKTMGLSAYGKPSYFKILESCFKFNGTYTFNDEMNNYYKIAKRFSEDVRMSEQQSTITMWKLFIKDKIGLSICDKKINSFYDMDDNYKNLVSSVQCLLENFVIEMIRHYVTTTGVDNVCLSGGVALNCKMNGQILQKEFVKDLFINPAANDAGVSLGAALEFSNRLGLKSKTDGDFSPYLGIEFTDEEIIEILNDLDVKYRIVDDAAEFIGSNIAKNKVIALFQGRNEWGPRALGNRTIISSPKDLERLDYINQQIKSRELGRPLGPSILDEDKNILMNEVKSIGRYMNITYKAENHIDRYPAIIHVDKTFRPQFVNQELNELYYRQLTSIKDKVRDSIVINTSFNLKTPIIFHIEDAVEFFNNSKLDVLVFNNKIIMEKL